MGLKEIKGDWREGDCAVLAERKVTLSIEKQGGQQQAWTTGAVKGKSREENQKENKKKKLKIMKTKKDTAKGGQEKSYFIN